MAASRRIILPLILALALSRCTEVSTPSITGMWQLESMDIIDSTGRMTPYRGGMQGYLLYEKSGHIALHLSEVDFEESEMIFRNFTDTLAQEKLRYLTKSYHYIGEYEMLHSEMSGDTLSGEVEHLKLVHSNPNEFGEHSVRRFKMLNDTLWMEPIESRNASIRLVWVRKT